MATYILTITDIEDDMVTIRVEINPPMEMDHGAPVPATLADVLAAALIEAAKGANGITLTRVEGS